MNARIRRSAWRRRRKGIEGIQFFEYDTASGISALDIEMVDWFVGRSKDPISGEEELHVLLIELSPDSRPKLLKLSHVKIDGLFYSLNGERSPLGSEGDPDYLIRCDVNGVPSV